jgi:putative membrane protein
MAVVDGRHEQPTGSAGAADKRTKRPRFDEVGEAPDARFSFANERTFLAWNRTALGCIVAGLAVTHVLEPEGSQTGPKIVGVALMVLGALLAAFSYANWESNERAMRLKKPIRHSPLPMLVSVVTAVVAIAAVIYSLV